MTRNRLHRHIEAQTPRKRIRDLLNRLRFGPDAPRSDETIWIRPSEVETGYRRVPGYTFRRRHSGLVADGPWDRHRRPLEEMAKIRACRAHFQEGVPWEETGIYDEMMRRIAAGRPVDGCRTRADVIARYAAIDAMYERIRADGGFQTMKAQEDFLRGEHGGVFVHIDRNGLPMLGGNGNHRIAIARILDLPLIPAHLGVVHRRAFETGLFQRLRQRMGDALGASDPATP